MLAFDNKMRPAPPGVSIGHPRITAGTLGTYVRRGQNDDWLILSNNHVLADVNEAIPGDFIRQPGTYDGGTTSDRFARLEEYVHINGGSDKKENKSAETYWKAVSAPGNAGARMVGCPYRLRTTIPHRIEQPEPNLVDAALARPIMQEWVNRDHMSEPIGVIKGFKDFQLGDGAHKAGRTTEYTRGEVEGVNMFLRVQFGNRGIKEFGDQVLFRGENGSNFSDGGDSGSAIISLDGFFGALLFAGGGDATFGNRVGNVASLLGVRI
jgi:hypothetical protein